MQIVNIDRVSYRYDGGYAIQDISFSAEEGDLVGIIGPNGSGKTTLFNCMLGILTGYSGTITIFGQDIRKSKAPLKQIGYVPQKHAIEPGFPATVEEIVSLGIMRGKPARERIITALETVDMAREKDRRIGELSGGQQQRVLIAKALVNDPALLILDEPATGIDIETQNRFYSLMTRLNKENKLTIIMSSHDLDAVNRLANRVACINRSMFFHGDTHEFFENEDLLKKYSEASMQAHMHLHSHH
ncbi:metal ABC transporter ATP-binding protein [Nitrososphaera viennensis]|nr:metal ABC transporter ATP-binding protein [Nitrososphaera viennensis]AIC16363.1 putative Zinc uptake transporter, ATP-binding protein [Nitrososphaera viennensis EN76]